MSDLVGRTILHYKVVEKIGQGGMGVVYKAEDAKLKREVAIKFLPHHISINEEEKKRFEIEAQAAASLNHSNIATIYAIEEAGGEMFISMEYIEGTELKGKIKSGLIPVDEAIKIAIQIAEGLEAAHKKGIVHRDIKSQNIMVTQDGKIKIMDFGLAKVKGGSQVTRIGTTVGTVAYMSPEQARGEEVDHRTDIWSFGVVLYEILTGQLPFKGDYEQAVIYSIFNEAPAPINHYSKNCPPALIEIVNKCLEKNNNDRYHSMSGLLQDFELLKQDPDYEIKTITKSKTGTKTKTPHTIVKKSLAVILVLAIIIALSFFLPDGWQKVKEIAGWNAAPEEQHLIILPIKNIGGDESKLGFCDGLMETLSSNLTKIEQFHGSLWVVPASEVFQNKIMSVKDAHSIYGVNLAVTGSLQFMNKLLRLTLNLVDAKNLRQLNSSILDIESKDISSIQDKAVIELLKMLHIELKPELKGILVEGKTSVPEAYEYYVGGRGNLQRYENIENVEESIRLFKLATEKDPNYALAYAGLGEAYWRNYEFTKKTELVEMALSKAKKAFEIDSSLASINVTLGIIYNGTGKYDLAVLHFKKALSNNSSDASALRGLAKTYESLDNISEAERTYKRAIKLKPDYWAGYNDLGVFYYRHSRYEDAIKQFQEVNRITPDNYRGYNNLGGIYYMLERWTDAREMFEKSLQIHKTYNIYSNLGTLYYIEGKYDDAAKMYEQAIKLNDNDYLTWGNLAAAYYWTQDKKSEAKSTYRNAITLAEEKLKINPNDPEVVSNLAGYYAEVGDTSKAMVLIERSINAASNNVMVMFRAATIYEHFGNREKALYWIDKALENGYSRSEIENQPELKQLIADNDYKQIVLRNEKAEEN